MKRYDKLVRDRIPQLIRAHGRRPEVTRVSGEVYRAYLRKKLVEEAQELAHADEPLEELADVYEVIRALLAALGRSWEELERRAERKRARRGGFERGLVLKAVHDDRAPE